MRSTIRRLRHRLTLEAVTRIPDGGGGASEVWSAVAQIWGQICPTGGTESFDADARTSQVTHEIIVRHRSGLHPSMRLHSGTRQFEITAIIDIDERRRWLKCLCVETNI